MNSIATFLRGIAKLKFRIFGLATIKDISSEMFEDVVGALINNGWRYTSRYRGFDAGIDYDCVRFRKGFSTLKCEWEYMNEWSIEGRKNIIEPIAAQNGLRFSNEWRWSMYDES